jgi:hypothetical protein
MMRRTAFSWLALFGSVSRLSLLGFGLVGGMASLGLADDSACTGSDATCQAAVKTIAVGKNTEQKPAAAAGQSPISISVDGETVFGSALPEDQQRKTDVKLEDVDIQVKFDGLGVVPVLNVSTWPVRRSYQAGETVNFLGSNNYPAWIAKSEVRIFERGADLQGTPLYSVAATPEGLAQWTMPKEGPGDLVYVFRVTDDKGQFDETKPLSLQRVSEALPQHEPQDAAVAPGYGDDRTAFRNIPVYGGAITVSGHHVPEGHAVHVLGDSVPVDAEHGFVVQRILPPGDHNVDVSVFAEQGKSKGKGLEFNREVYIPTSEWFYVGLADLTVGKRFGSSHIEDVNPGEYDNVYTKGRFAFYVKGKIQGRYLLTAAADTGEGAIQDIFKGLDKKDPRQLLRRINPDDYYPVYGDDSTSVEDAPTRGKFYVRLEKGDSHVMWGNFKTHISGTQFLRNERSLYGADAVYKSEQSTEFGERKTELQVYAAQPGTLPQHDILLGTGGSAYFLKHQDVTIGSETVTVEVRDDFGHVIGRHSLRADFDYDIDYIQGLIILRKPLGSSVGDGEVVQDGALGGNKQYLVVNYEYSPAAGDTDGYVLGGRAQQWVGEHVRLGATAAREKTGAADQTLYGADITVRRSDQTYIEGEIAQSKGPGFGNSLSNDGGLTISDTASAGVHGKTATAYRLHGHVGLADVTDGKVEGEVGGYLEKKQGGFSSLDDQVTVTQRSWGGEATVKLAARSAAHVKFDELKSDDGKVTQELNADAKIGIGEHVELIPGAKFTNKGDTTAGATDTGKRTDVGIVAKYVWDEGKSAYVLAQTTVDRSGTRKNNDRIGVGGEMPVTEKLSATAEVSDGSGGVGARAGLDYHPTADDHYYVGYKLEREDDLSGITTSSIDRRDLGTFVTGAHHRFNDQFSAFTEDTTDPFGDRRSLTQTYGVEYTPSAEWKLGAALEAGKIKDDTINTASGLKNSDFRRLAGSVSAEYNADGIEGRIKGEARFERSSDHTRDRDSYLLGAGFAMKTADDWRVQADLDAVISNANDDTLNGKYIEGSIGYAYRPIDNDRLNALFKYTLLYDYPGADQVTVNGTTKGPAQLTNILSADVAYDLNKIVTVGAKYGFRIGETRDRSGVGPWVKSSAHLGIIRADIHFVNKWDALLEGRILWDASNHGTKLGLLAGIYREINDNFRIGVGYNFGRFSDDLRDMTYDDGGVFINAIGKF